MTDIAKALAQKIFEDAVKTHGITDPTDRAAFRAGWDAAAASKSLRPNAAPREQEGYNAFKKLDKH